MAVRTPQTRRQTSSGPRETGRHRPRWPRSRRQVGRFTGHEPRRAAPGRPDQPGVTFQCGVTKTMPCRPVQRDAGDLAGRRIQLAQVVRREPRSRARRRGSPASHGVSATKTEPGRNGPVTTSTVSPAVLVPNSRPDGDRAQAVSSAESDSFSTVRWLPSGEVRCRKTCSLSPWLVTLKSPANLGAERGSFSFESGSVSASFTADPVTGRRSRQSQSPRREQRVHGRSAGLPAGRPSRDKGLVLPGDASGTWFAGTCGGQGV
jgi:hypothetical protein